MQNEAIHTSKRFVVSYQQAIYAAADLASEEGENPEYDRALCELIANLWAVYDMPTGDRASYIEADIEAEKNRQREMWQ